MGNVSLCVYCGSSIGTSDAYADTAKSLGQYLASSGITLIYGGAAVGVMGVLADEALAHGGEVIGVMPKIIVQREVTHSGLTQLIEVEDMHQRKAKMMALADGFIALPGGIGTLEELFEALTWLQLQIHAKPCGLLNVNGFYDDLLQFLKHAAGQGFVRQNVLDKLMVAQTASQLVPRLLANR
jgi:uncharacterized protein (TIGR00730 family)